MDQRILRPVIKAVPKELFALVKKSIHNSCELRDVENILYHAVILAFIFSGGKHRNLLFLDVIRSLYDFEPKFLRIMSIALSTDPKKGWFYNLLYPEKEVLVNFNRESVEKDKKNMCEHLKRLRRKYKDRINARSVFIKSAE